MGLDWVATIELDDDEECKSYFRGKGVAYDKNIEALEEEVENDCYGEEDHYLSEDQIINITHGIQSCLDQDKETIDLEGWEDYKEWSEFMNEALDFLQNEEHIKIFCWY